MAGIDDVLERLRTDPSFKQQISDDPQAALAGYELTTEDLSLLATRVADSTDGQHHTGHSALLSLFTEMKDDER